jgi:hypothetical protein
METNSVVQCMNELLQLYLSDVQPRLQLATAQAMHIALDKCSDVVHITDQNLNIQVNISLYNALVSSEVAGGRCTLHLLGSVQTAVAVS